MICLLGNIFYELLVWLARVFNIIAFLLLIFLILFIVYSIWIKNYKFYKINEIEMYKKISIIFKDMFVKFLTGLIIVTFFIFLLKIQMNAIVKYIYLLFLQIVIFIGISLFYLLYQIKKFH